MVLTRSDSSSSAWFVPSTAHDDTLERDQRRVRHLHSISVRNLTLDPALDSLFTRPSTAYSILPEDDEPTTATTSVDKGKKVRARASSNASWTSAFSNEREEREGRELVLDSGNRFPRTRPRRSSSAGTLLSRAQKIKEEGEEAEGEEDGGYSIPSTATHSPQPAPIPSASTSNSFPFPFPSPSEELTTSTSTSTTDALKRARSTSRASVNSNGTTGSNSTIRQAPRLPPNPPPHPTTARLPSSTQFAAREQKRRTEALRRKLLDSFISIELVPPERSVREEETDLTVSSGRKRGNTIVGTVGGSSRPGRNHIKRSDSSSSISSLRKGLSRRRTVSSSLVPTLSTPSRSKQDEEQEEENRRLPPFYVSQAAKETVNPCFQIDQSDFLVPSLGNDTFKGDSTIQFPDDDSVDSWFGLRESRIKVRVFARRRLGEREREEKSNKGKGKVGVNDSPEVDEEAGWKVLTEWDVDLSSLVSLGRNPSAFPSLPPNTLLFTLRTPSSPFSFSPPSNLPVIGSSTTTISPNDLEYFTAPLETLFAQHRASSSPSSIQRRTLRLLRPSLSDDDGCSCSSSGEDADSDDGFGGGGGNVSDPGVNSSGTRARSNTIRSSNYSRSRGRRKRANSLWRERVRIEEERRRKIELLERTRRETRMVELAKLEVVERLWVGEKELERVRAERRECELRLAEYAKEGAVEELRRDREEREDRVGDLEGVKEAVEEEVEDLEKKLERRKEALELRRDRLDRARKLDEKNRVKLARLTRDLDDTQRTISTLQASILSRRTQIVTLLSHFFPIEPVLPSSANPSPPPLLFSILSLALPNSTYPSSYSDDLLSSALGHAAQLTLTLAAYLRVPLCYPIVWRGSRSVVKDEISMMKGPRAFPLYGKGVDQYRFDYGVFLLNKNIEQLMYSQNLTVLDLRNTLPNLKTLVLSLSYGEWTDDYAKASLRPESIFADEEDFDSPRARAEESEEATRQAESQGEGESSNSSGSTESTSEPSTTPETSIESLPPREGGEPISSVSGRSRSSSLASAASTVRPNRATSPSSSSSSSSPSAVKTKRSSSRDSKASIATVQPSSSNRSNGGFEKGNSSVASVVPNGSPSSKISTIEGIETVKVKLEDGKRKRKESGGSSYGSRFWSAVAGKAGAERAHHSHRSDRSTEVDGIASTMNGTGEEE
ncbi:hypothetical protein JCM5350_006782 [Sporobolomyces pararoseus]